MSQLFSDLPRTPAEAKAGGSMYYFTGKPCIHGHIDKRYVSTSSCYTCRVEHGKAQYATNKEAIRERKKAHREAHIDYAKAYYAANKEHIRERDKARYAAKVGKTPEELGTRRTPEPARYVYFLVVKDAASTEKLFLKVGITNNPASRLKYHTRQLAKHGLIFDTILIKDFETEELSREVERRIKSSFIVYESDIPGFQSECFMYLPQFEQSMQKFLTSANGQLTC